MPGFELFGNLERQEVNDVLDNGVLMRYGFDAMRQKHWKAKRLEETLQNTLGVKHAHLVSSGTAALTVALAAAGVGAGDEVIMPTFTFVASFEAILALGATPILVDINDTLGLCPKAVLKAITPKTKALMVVQMCGSMADMEPLKKISKTHKLHLIEDACQAIGAKFNGNALGSIGDLGCFSFDFVKTITSGEGGAIVTNNTDFYTLASQYSDHGHDHVGSDRGAEAHPYLGYNFRISELHAAVGLAQAKRLSEFVAIQKQHYLVLRKALSEIPEIRFRKVPKGGEESYAFLSFFLPDLATATAVSKGFQAAGIDACFHYYNNNWHYVRHWNHLKTARSLYPLSESVKATLGTLQEMHFEQSDLYISRNISCLIKLSWTPEMVAARAQKMVAIIKAIL